MDDHQFAASVRELTGKETNEDALASLGGTEVPSLEEKLADVREKLVTYFRTRWQDMKRKPNEDEAVQIIVDGFGEHGADGTEGDDEGTALASPE